MHNARAVRMRGQGSRKRWQAMQGNASCYFFTMNCKETHLVSGQVYPHGCVESLQTVCIEKLYLQTVHQRKGGRVNCSSILHSWPWSESCLVVSDSSWPYGLYNPWNSPGQNTGVGSCSLLQGIFLTQGSNPVLSHCKRMLYPLSHQGSLIIVLILLERD